MKHRGIALSAAICTLLTLMTGCGGGDSYYRNKGIVSEGDFYGEQGAPAAEAEGYNGDAELNEGNAEEYASMQENSFVFTTEQPLSTFSVDVDTASYSNVRRMLRGGQTVDANAVRLEEMINYFNYDYPEPTDGAPLSVTTEMYECPWNTDNQLFLVGLQAEKIDLSGRAPMNLVFLIDVSGSMYSYDKLPLVQKAVAMLAENLNENDRVSIVTYAGQETVVLEGVPGNEVGTITDAIYSLEASGSTAGERGIQRAYEIAQEYFIEGGNNRVLLATDGDLNVGLSSVEELTELVEEKRESGVFLSVLGFGTGNLKDDRLEALADNGNGNYAYIDSELEARKVLVQEMGGTLYTVAKDVKLQTEFNSEMVESYRLVGYENRILAAEDFDNDKVDAGEIGSGHNVTALYELVLTDKGKQAAGTIDLADEGAQAASPSQLMTISMRWKAPGSDQSQLREYPVYAENMKSAAMPKNLAFASAVTEFGMLLGQRTPYNASYAQIRELLAKTDLQDSYRQEFAELVEYLNDSRYAPKTELNPAPTEALPQGTPEEDVSVQTAAAQEQQFAPEVYATYCGQPVTLPDAEAIVKLTEDNLDANNLINTPFVDEDFTECAENGLLVRIYYNSYGATGKELYFAGEEKPYYIYDIALMMGGGYYWLVANNGGTHQVYGLPEEVNRALWQDMQQFTQSEE